MQLAPQQKEALLAVRAWLEAGIEPLFRLFGYAGTGKTTLAKGFSADIEGLALFAAFTGKAASVLRSKGCLNATTIHKLIYNPAEKSKLRLMDLKHMLVKENEKKDEKSLTEVSRLTKEILDEEKRLKQPSFALKCKEASDLSRAKLVIIDECSMVDRKMGEDLLSFECPILVLGDPAQLPPVRGCGYFTEGTPDIMLTEIHRQAEGSPIIDLATKVRLGEYLSNGTYGTSLVIPRRELTPEKVMEYDQILVGRNSTRQSVNRRCREILGRKDLLPVTGDKIVCLKNNHELGLLNGELWVVVSSNVIDDEMLAMSILRPEQSKEDPPLEIPVYRHAFEGRELGHWEHGQAEEFDYGYALTVHKSQGSQWGSVLVFDESYCFRDTAQRWLYTAITRASNRVTLARS